MISRKLLLSSLLTGALVLALLSENAYAYVDPGTGSYIVQMLFAGVIAALFSIKLFWSRIKGFFKRLFSKQA